MKCLQPVTVRFDSLNFKIFDFHGKVGLEFPCGRCKACRMNRTREWSLRLIMEARSYPISDVAFVTLTYNDEHLPLFDDGQFVVGNLFKRDVQLFIKRLRKFLDYPVRYFLVGEYGSLTSRPHYHALFFGLKPDDWDLIDKCWQNGFTLTKSFYDETAGYVAGYVQKKLFSNDDYSGLQPPFLLCSRGIGLEFFMQHVKQFSELGYIPNKGFKFAIPRYLKAKAVDAGFMSPTCIDEVFMRQRFDKKELFKVLKDRGLSLDDYNYYQSLKVESKFNVSNMKRNNNVEV